MRKIIFSLVLIFLSSCSSDGRRDVIVSERIGVCARISQDVSFGYVEKGIDYDLVDARIGETKIKVYMGYQPNFPKDQLKLELHRDNGFYPSGEYQKKLLLSSGQKQEDGAIRYVMLEAEDLPLAKRYFYSPDVFYVCGGNAKRP